MGTGELCRFGILTASDRASSGEYEDLSGPAIEDFLREALSSPWEIVRKLVLKYGSNFKTSKKYQTQLVLSFLHSTMIR